MAIPDSRTTPQLSKRVRVPRIDFSSLDVAPTTPHSEKINSVLPDTHPDEQTFVRKSGKTIYVGMSGGVDSSVSAALLKEQGYQVVGVYMKNWTADVLGYKCPWREDLNDAQSVAAILDIPLKVFDFQKEYKQHVVDYMVSEYRAGRTPNPDVICNQEIKFKLFLKTALKDGANMIATGHYAKIINNKLAVPKDIDKDQTYFLYRVTTEALACTIFPLGNYKKPEVRELAKKFNLPVAKKPDSTGICFIGEVDVKSFLQQYIKPKTGDIKKRDGTVVGQHDGVAFYTIGQRHGLNIGGGRPYYIIDKDTKTNTLYVTDQLDDDELYCDNFAISEPHWINDLPKANKEYQVRTRYRGTLQKGRVVQRGQKFMVELNDADRAITPGQSAVIYDGQTVLGGGVISI